MELNNRNQRRGRRAMSEINVVPYIDVMLVLLIIFMTTAPLLTEGVSVNLPKANAKVVESPEETDKVIVSVDAEGQFFINDEKTASSLQTVRSKARAFYAQRPELPFYVKGDAAVAYDSVMQAMVALQQAGVPTVGLVTKPVDGLLTDDLQDQGTLNSDGIEQIEMKTDL